jgi:hypothetical protein
MLDQMGRVCGRPDYISWLICTTGLCGSGKGRVGTVGGIGEAVYVVEAVGWETAPAPLLLLLLPMGQYRDTPRSNHSSDRLSCAHIRVGRSSMCLGECMEGVDPVDDASSCSHASLPGARHPRDLAEQQCWLRLWWGLNRQQWLRVGG